MLLYLSPGLATRFIQGGLYSAECVEGVSLLKNAPLSV
jgi:hypothetical protein